MTATMSHDQTILRNSCRFLSGAGWPTSTLVFPCVSSSPHIERISVLCWETLYEQGSL